MLAIRRTTSEFSRREWYVSIGILPGRCVVIRLGDLLSTLCVVFCVAAVCDTCARKAAIPHYPPTESTHMLTDGSD